MPVDGNRQGLEPQLVATCHIISKRHLKDYQAEACLDAPIPSLKGAGDLPIEVAAQPRWEFSGTTATSSSESETGAN